MRTRIRFDEISIKGIFKWKGTDGKPHQRTERFWQTLNPWNKNAEGYPKTHNEIMAEIQEERKAWLERMRQEHSSDDIRRDPVGSGRFRERQVNHPQEGAK